MDFAVGRTFRLGSKGFLWQILHRFVEVDLLRAFSREKNEPTSYFTVVVVSTPESALFSVHEHQVGLVVRLH